MTINYTHKQNKTEYSTRVNKNPGKGSFSTNKIKFPNDLYDFIKDVTAKTFVSR